MSKDRGTRLTETWTFIDGIRGAPAPVILGLKAYHDNLTRAQRSAVNEAVAQGDHVSSAPGLTVGDARTRRRERGAAHAMRQAPRPAPDGFRSASIRSAMSGGTALSNRICASVTGWAKPSVAACSA